MVALTSNRTELGAHYLGQGRCKFTVWAPFHHRVDVHVLADSDKASGYGNTINGESLVPLIKQDSGYFEDIIPGIYPDTCYRYRLSGERLFADPASRCQPEGVNGPSQVVDPIFEWEDEHWRGIALADYIVYELHVGTYTTEGTFEAIIPYLDTLCQLGVTAIELMPIGEFSGHRNWGYDGVFPFAVESSYGGPIGLKRLINACHGHGLAVVLDVVYNHLGPEGNHLSEFAPYFTSRYHTIWGAALNYDTAYSDEVRNYFIENALMWVKDYHIDALRLDAVHAIYDAAPISFLEELAATLRHQADALNRRIYLMPENARNDPKLLRPSEQYGHGMHSQWNDDFHHALHVLLTGEESGYYGDYQDRTMLATAICNGYIYSGQYSPYRKHRHGAPASGLSGENFIVFSQNHDQIGNRMLGERLSTCVSFEALKLAAATVILSPFLPLIFMGEEYAETAPFLYFISHSDQELVEAVRSGRKIEFAGFAWQGEVPDPQSPETFTASKLDHSLRYGGQHRVLWNFYRHLIALRKENSIVYAAVDTERYATMHDDATLVSLLKNEARAVWTIHYFSNKKTSLTLPFPAGYWRQTLDSHTPNWQAEGSEFPHRIENATTLSCLFKPYHVVQYVREPEP